MNDSIKVYSFQYISCVGSSLQGVIGAYDGVIFQYISCVGSRFALVNIPPTFCQFQYISCVGSRRTYNSTVIT